MAILLKENQELILQRNQALREGNTNRAAQLDEEIAINVNNHLQDIKERITFAESQRGVMSRNK